jgi:hypothetical protein
MCRVYDGPSGAPINFLAQRLAPRLRFTPPVTAGHRVLVHLFYDRDGRPDVFVGE